MTGGQCKGEGEQHNPADALAIPVAHNTGPVSAAAFRPG